VIGSAPDCDFVLADPNVALRHREIRRVGGGEHVLFAAGNEPVVVNGRAVSELELVDNDALEVGPMRLRYKYVSWRI
jgi:predicted component of type VI protein secretion system